MQTATIKFTKNDLAKYPFLKEAADYVKTLELKIEDLASPEFSQILERAKERVEEAILYTIVSRKLQNEEVEILSFPTATMLAAATENSFIKRRYALAEAKQTYNDLKFEPRAKILAIAENFQWKILTVNAEEAAAPYEFKLHFTNYLKNTTSLRERKWKLVNRPLTHGNVYLTKNETARLLSEEVRRHIEKRLEIKELPKLPQKITETAETLKSLTIEKIGKAEIEGIPKTVNKEAFPPCITALYEAASKGRHISHIARFTLTTFLVNIGMPTENIVDLFRASSDFNERLTRYQVEHIAGERGSRTRYKPPKCQTLQTHGVCTNPDTQCKEKTHHPLVYYRKRIRDLK
ncbi:MAG: DNA primase large subunit PriL [Candidatus Bathyarchaeota archaeon]|jgi:DNA primase large subunit|nr:DNA primase large subunit PriL [Candidatus Bathyarchaeota archaeon A05DMB-3]MDH7607367.1 DNA primase large subunit PriL [Candidatus Bathyarchaeota archaeon]